MNRRQLLAGIGTAALLPRAALALDASPRIERLSPALDAKIAPGAQVETIATGIRWAEGPVWNERGGYLLFSDPPANIMRRWSRGGGLSIFLQPSGAGGLDPKVVREAGSNGLGMDASGRLLIANSGGRSIDRVDLTTRRRTVLVDRFEGKRFNSPNDLAVSRTGAIYFTDPPYGLAAGDASPAKELQRNGVYRWTPTGVALVDGSLTRPNGIALSPDERTLFVSVSDEKKPVVTAYDLDARGMPTASRVWLDASTMHGPGLPDGMKVARDGTHIQSVPGGMMLLTPDAQPLGLIATGAAIANAAIGERGTALYLTASDRVLRVPLLPGWA
jgi:gluconolactonase